MWLVCIYSSHSAPWIATRRLHIKSSIPFPSEGRSRPYSVYSPLRKPFHNTEEERSREQWHYLHFSGPGWVVSHGEGRWGGWWKDTRRAYLKGLAGSLNQRTVHFCGLVHVTRFKAPALVALIAYTWGEMRDAPGSSRVRGERERGGWRWWWQDQGGFMRRRHCQAQLWPLIL